MLKGIQAFDACWLHLRSLYPTGRAENLMIAQAMGQVTDRYGTVEEVEQALPKDLKVLFRKLVHAYFHGYPVNSPPTEASGKGSMPKQSQSIEPTQKADANIYGESKKASIKPSLVQKILRKRRLRDHAFSLSDPNESATLILENPFGAQS
ncbi:MAG: hypothetical protein QNJ46_29540 [Leptolyngbyaceae cyanobacterium MO_188.B28]|nr:hypothetical protein [Leptolyngbyaceae cyanobacterium MO_188.B28]